MAAGSDRSKRLLGGTLTFLLRVVVDVVGTAAATQRYDRVRGKGGGEPSMMNPAVWPLGVPCVAIGVRTEFVLSTTRQFSNQTEMIGWTAGWVTAARVGSVADVWRERLDLADEQRFGEPVSKPLSTVAGVGMECSISSLASCRVVNEPGAKVKAIVCWEDIVGTIFGTEEAVDFAGASECLDVRGGYDGAVAALVPGLFQIDLGSHTILFEIGQDAAVHTPRTVVAGESCTRCMKHAGGEMAVGRGKGVRR